MSLSTLLLLHVFPALLPPKDGDEWEYYAILGFDDPRRVSIDDIRKAYRKKSLELHPDKVAQRRQQNAAEAAAEYEKVQEAYGVLGDEKHRQQYAVLGNSPARYRFVHTGGLYNPARLYENLAKASTIDKTRLVVVVSIVFMILLLQPILVAAKVNQVIEQEGTLQNTDWVVILIPTWMLYGLLLIFWVAMAILAPNKAKPQVIATLLTSVCFLSGLIILAKKWDEPLSTNKHWHRASVPFYLAIFCRVLSAYLVVAAAQDEFQKMVSLQHLETTEACCLEDMSEERRAQVLKDNHVITVDEEAVAAALEILAKEGVEFTDDDVEALRVTTSPEFEAMDAMTQAVVTPAGNMLVFGVTFIALVAAKVEGQIDASWWLVFLPIWILLSQDVARGLFSCCCGSVSGEEVVVMGRSDENSAEKEKGENDTDIEVGHLPVSTGMAAMQSSMEWATAEGDMKDFHSPTSAPVEPLDIGEAGNKEIPSDEEASQTDQLGSKNETFLRQKPPGAPANNLTVEHSEEEQDTEGSNLAPAEQVDKDTSENAEEPEIKFDEDTFRAWQQAQTEADQSAMDAQAKAQGQCCVSLFQIIVVCLIVGKLENDFESDTQDPSDTGYSAFWILFPIFLIAGLMFCCCSCLIYTAGATGLDELVDKAKRKDDEEPNEASASSNVVPTPPPSHAHEPVKSDDLDTTPVSKVNEHNAEASNENMNDLD
jgi:cytochrome bd-type quinol oxidase subunit 2